MNGSVVATDTNVGKWDRWYGLVDEPAPYGDDTTYRIAAEFLAPCATVEDWGCGKGWMRQFIPTGYRGIDGSRTPFADQIADLTTYRSNVAGIVLRHVLEHNYDWAAILTNAAASATERLVVILFTPPADSTTEIAYSEDPGVPDIAFALDDLLVLLAGWNVEVETLETDTQYEVETVLRCAR